MTVNGDDVRASSTRLPMAHSGVRRPLKYPHSSQSSLAASPLSVPAMRVFAPQRGHSLTCLESEIK